MTKQDPPATLIDFKDKKLNVIRELKQTEWEEYRHAVTHLSDFHSARMLLPMIQSEVADFRAVIGRARSAVTESGKLDAIRDEINLQSNRHFLSYLAAVRTYLDHTETRLKRYYGPGEPFATFKRARSAAYDESFAYRFLDQLRNYGQHCGLPIGHIEISSSAATPVGPTLRQVTFSFDPQALLARGGDTWKKNVRVELGAMSGILDVETILDQVTARLVEIETATLEAERPHLLTAARPITDLFRPIAESGGVPAVGIIRPTGPNTTQVEFARPPQQALNWLGFEYIGLEF